MFKKAAYELSRGILNKNKFQTSLGVTGSGKTFTMASIIKNVQMPTLVIVHNKTLAAQLYSEFKSFSPNSFIDFVLTFS